ncbi:coatomer subunit epsilon [Holotrichia oblita]|uniref:Coatomer subunit epsilon n=1 Tax=Holotrichia oblita TaxID=644536 RepID=A0ACB9SWQ5_HOLOL|nr:coatomer subunit epsilon [Holotrichia oblita]
MSRPQQDVDELFEIRNYFHIGNYQQCINEAQKLRKPSSPEIAVERDIFMYRSYMAQNKYLVVLDDIKPSSAEKLQPLKLLAEYLSNKSRRDAIVTQLDQKLSASANVDNEVWILVAAIIYQRENNFETAYRLLHTIESLDAMAMILDILLKINRVDLAMTKLAEMREKDDDATLTQLAQAWVFCASGKDDLRNAYYIYQDLIDKYGATPLLLNGQAVTYIAQGKMDEAETALLEAFDKDPNYADTLVNLIVLSQITAKNTEVASRYLAQLKDSHLDHPFLKERDLKEREFENICKQYSPSVGRG